MPWKGNIRELENAVERNIVTSPEEYITKDKTELNATEKTLPEGVGLKKLLEEREREILLQAQKKYRTTRSIASALGLSQATAARKLKQMRDSSPVAVTDD